jgi:hypothetical protein
MARSHSDLPTLSLLRGSYIKVLSWLYIWLSFWLK